MDNKLKSFTNSAIRLTDLDFSLANCFLGIHYQDFAPEMESASHGCPLDDRTVAGAASDLDFGRRRVPELL